MTMNINDIRFWKIVFPFITICISPQNPVSFRLWFCQVTWQIQFKRRFYQLHIFGFELWKTISYHTLYTLRLPLVLTPLHCQTIDMTYLQQIWGKQAHMLHFYVSNMECVNICIFLLQAMFTAQNKMQQLLNVRLMRAIEVIHTYFHKQYLHIDIIYVSNFCFLHVLC